MEIDDIDEIGKRVRVESLTYILEEIARLRALGRQVSVAIKKAKKDLKEATTDRERGYFYLELQILNREQSNIDRSFLWMFGKWFFHVFKENQKPSDLICCIYAFMLSNWYGCQVLTVVRFILMKMPYAVYLFEIFYFHSYWCAIFFLGFCAFQLLRYDLVAGLLVVGNWIMFYTWAFGEYFWLSCMCLIVHMWFCVLFGHNTYLETRMKKFV